MKPQSTYVSSVLKNWPIVVGIAILPFALMGVISMPHASAPVKKNGIVNIDALIHQVNRLNQEKKHQEAINVLKSALEGESPDSILRPLLLQSFDMFLEEQIRIGEQGIRNNSEDSDSYLRVADSLELLDNSVRAMEILVHGVSIKQDAPNLWMQIGKLELKAGRDMEALDVFKEVIKENPKNSDAFNNAAFILVRAKSSTEQDLADAQNYALKARKLDPKNPEYIDTLAEVHFRSGDAVEAQSLIKEAIKLAPEKDFFKNQLQRFSGALAPKLAK